MHIQLKYLVLSVFLFTSNLINAQANCDSVYSSSNVNETAEFRVSQKEFKSFMNDKILPLVSEEQEATKRMIPSLNIHFTISSNGDLIKVEFPEFNARPDVQEAMAKEFIKLGKWRPAKLNGKNVCSEFDWKMNCIKWQ